MNHRLNRIRIWALRVLLALIIIWGSFAAVIAFLVRFEMGPFAAGNTPTGSASQPERELHWRKLSDPEVRPMSPEEIAQSFLAAIRENDDNILPASGPDPERLSLQLTWRPADSTAIWTAVYRVGCDCPYLRPEDIPKVSAAIDPLTGEVDNLTGAGVILLPSHEHPDTASGEEAGL